MANTVHINVISPYHFSVPRGGISLGASHFCTNVSGAFAISSLFTLFADDVNCRKARSCKWCFP